MRSSVFLAGAVLVAGLLAACSGGGMAQTVPGSQGAVPTSRHLHGAHAVAMVPTVRDRCPTSKFSFCVTISPSNSGPYWRWCGNASCSGSSYDMLANDTIAMTRSGKNMDRQLPSSWAPAPGNPTDNYITEHKSFTAGLNPKFTETSTACYYDVPSDCYTVVVGLIPGN